MNTALIVADDFTPNPTEIRSAALAGEFGTVNHQGADFTGISKQGEPDLKARIEALVGFAINITLSCFRVNYTGENPNSWIHADQTEADYAVVFYLNLPEQCRGGTGFWRHRVYGWDAMPTEDQIKAAGETPGQEFDHSMLQDWSTKEIWELHSLVGMKFNRLIVYPTRCFHSRVPFDGFGSTPRDGRLIWVCFFNRA